MAVNFGSSGERMAMASKMLPIITERKSRPTGLGGTGPTQTQSASPGLNAVTPLNTSSPAPSQPRTGRLPDMRAASFMDSGRTRPMGLGGPRAGATGDGSGSTPATATTGPKLGDVATRINAIIDDNSPLMQRAATSGTQSLNRRGLGNSSMAIQAAEEAVYGAAAPIASQESAQASQQSIANLQAATQKSIAAENSKTQRDLAAQETKLRTDLANQQTALQRDLATLENEKAMALANKDDVRLRELAAKEDVLRRDLAALEAQNKSQLVSAELAARQQDNLASQMTQAANQLSASTAALTNNPKLPAAARSSYQSALTAQYNDTVKNLQSIYGVTVAPAATTTTTPATTATAPAAREALAA